MAASETVDRCALVPMMFGQLSAGLRQLCVRAILQHTLVTSKHGEDPCSCAVQLRSCQQLSSRLVLTYSCAVLQLETLSRCWTPF